MGSATRGRDRCCSIILCRHGSLSRMDSVSCSCEAEYLVRLVGGFHGAGGLGEGFGLRRQRELTASQPVNF
jgi:hypothetical protein